jgi:hypothetical protein
MALPPSHSHAVLPSPRILVPERIERRDNQFRIFVCTRQPAFCPACNGAQQQFRCHPGHNMFRAAEISGTNTPGFNNETGESGEIAMGCFGGTPSCFTILAMVLPLLFPS